MSRKNVLIAIAVVLIGAGVVAANLYYKKDKGLAVTTDQMKNPPAITHRTPCRSTSQPAASCRNE